MKLFTFLFNSNTRIRIEVNGNANNKLYISWKIFKSINLYFHINIPFYLSKFLISATFILYEKWTLFRSCTIGIWFFLKWWNVSKFLVCSNFHECLQFCSFCLKENLMHHCFIVNWIEFSLCTCMQHSQWEWKFTWESSYMYILVTNHSLFATHAHALCYPHFAKTILWRKDQQEGPRIWKANYQKKNWFKHYAFCLVSILSSPQMHSVMHCSSIKRKIVSLLRLVFWSEMREKTKEPISQIENLIRFHL